MERMALAMSLPARATSLETDRERLPAGDNARRSDAPTGLFAF